MNPNILHFRAGLLALNLLGAVGVPAYAALSYWKTAEDAGVLAIADPYELAFRQGEADHGAGRASVRLDETADAFNPRRVVETAAEPAPEDVGLPEVPSRTGLLPAGPLADEHHLEYVFGIRREDPLRNFVILRRKDAVAAAGERTAARRSASLVQRPVRVPAVSPRRAGEQHPDEVSFFVADRWYWDADRGLDFMIHSADEKELVYWVPDRPGQMYALQYAGQQDLKRRDLEPAGTDVDRLPEQIKKVRFFFRSAKDFERLREEEYQDMLKGKGRGPLLSPGRLP